MAVDFNNDLYKQVMDVFARPVIVTPVVSQPGAPAYNNRAYYDTRELDVMTEDGGIFSDARSYIDIRIDEYPVLPMQGDYIDIPTHLVAGGTFEVQDLAGNGNAGGMITVQLKKRVTPKP